MWGCVCVYDVGVCMCDVCVYDVGVCMCDVCVYDCITSKWMLSDMKSIRAVSHLWSLNNLWA